MSLDTVTRIVDFFEANGFVSEPTGAEIYTIFRDKNYDLGNDSGGGPFCEVFIEASGDSFVGYGTAIGPDYTETGIVVVRIFADAGLGDLDLYSLSRVSDIIRDTFRDQTTGKQLKLWPTGGQQGMILFEDMSSRQTIEDDTTYDTVYRRKDIFINYQKVYN